jgi:hypothetical protein
MNRLLLEDAFPLDITPRPKILVDPVSNNYVFVDFSVKRITLFGADGNKKWTADLGPSIDKEFRRFPYYRNRGMPASGINVGLWDVSLEPGTLLVRVLANHEYSIDLSTGVITELPHT